GFCVRIRIGSIRVRILLRLSVFVDGLAGVLVPCVVGFVFVPGVLGLLVLVAGFVVFLVVVLVGFVSGRRLGGPVLQSLVEGVDAIAGSRHGSRACGTYQFAPDGFGELEHLRRRTERGRTEHGSAALQEFLWIAGQFAR